MVSIAMTANKRDEKQMVRATTTIVGERFQLRRYIRRHGIMMKNVISPLLVVILLFAHSALASVGGDLLWETVDQQGGKQEAAASVVDDSGNVVVTGYSKSVGGNEDFYTAKIDNMGYVVWRKSLDMGRDANEPDLPSEDDRGVAVAFDAAGNIVVAGYGSVSGNVNVMVMKYDTSGNELWTEPYVYDSAVGGADYPSALAIDSDDNIYIAGYSMSAAGTDDAMIIKLAADGTFIRVVNFDAGSNADDRFTNIAIGNDTPGIPDDDFVVATGYTWVDHGGGVINFDVLTVKFNSGGVEQWQAVYDGDNGGTASSDDRGLFVAVDGAYNVVVSGYTTTGSRKDMFTVKYGAYGDGSGGAASLWAAPVVYNGGEQNIPHGLWLDKTSGDIFVTGATFNNAGMDDFYTAGYASADGALLWQQIYDSPGTAMKDIPAAITGDNAGGIYVTGYSENGVSGDKDLLTLKYYQANGNLLWHDLHDGPQGGIQQSVQVAVAMSASANGSVFIAGWSGVQTDFDSGSATETAADNYTITDGSKINWTSDQWSSYYVIMTSGANQGENRRIVSNNVNSLTVESAFPNPVQNGDTYTINNPFDYDYYVVDYDRGGVNPPTGLTATLISDTAVDLSWQDNSPQVSEDDFCVERCAGYDCQNFSEITCFPADTMTSPAQLYHDTALTPTTRYSYRVRTKKRTTGDYSGYSDPAGIFTNTYNPVSPSWQYTYNSPDDSSDEAMAIVAGPDNNPVVTGDSNSVTGQFDYYTAKIDRADPLTELWSHRYDDPSNENDKARSISTDAAGDIFLAGYSSLYNGGTANTNDIFSFKFAAAGPDMNNMDFAHNYGALWMAQYSGPGGSDDRADAVDSASDGSANVVVGYGKNASNNDDIYVVKYLADGTEAWPGALPFDGGAGDYPSDVTFDYAGDVLVSGRTSNGTDNDMFLRKLSGADGSVLWTLILDSGYGNDGLNSVVTDAVGDVYVAGYISNASGNTDMYFAKYAGAGNGDGTAKLLWAKNIGGDGLSYDEAVSVNYDAGVNEILVAGMLTTTSGSIDYHVRRYDTLGNLIWKRTLDRDVADDFLVAMAMDKDGDICLAGNTDNGVNTDILSVCYDASGTLTGSTLFNGTADADDWVNAMTVNPLGEMFMAGYTINAAGNKDYLVIKAVSNTIQAPANFTATPHYTTVDLSWLDSSPDEDSFYIWRKDGTCAAGGAYNNIYMSAANETAFSDSGLSQGNTYCYRIQTMKGGITSIPVEIEAQTTTPPPPGCNAHIADSTQIDLDWNNTASGAEGVELLRCAGAGCTDFSQVAVLPAADNVYSDTSSCELAANNSNPYSYRVRVYNNSEGWQAASDCAIIYPVAAQAVDLHVNAVSEGEVALAWEDDNADASEYKIYRCEDTGTGCTPAYLTSVPNSSINGELLELRMNESAWTGASGEIIDASGNGTNATAQYGAALTTQGRIGNGGSFDGIDDQVSWAYPGGLPSNNFTLAAWVKAVDTHEIDGQSTNSVTGTSGQHWLFGPDMAGLSTESGAGVSVGTNGISVYEHSGGYMPPLAVYQGNLGTGWNHIVVTYTNRQPRIYLNGSLVQTGYTSPKDVVYAPQKVGGGPYGNFHGTVDEVRVYNRALSDTEVAALAIKGVYTDADISILPGHTYNYRVTASKTATCNWEGPIATGTASPVLSTPCPFHVVIADSNTIKLDWADNFGTEDGFHVDRCVGGGCLSSCDPDTANCRIGTTAVNAVNATDYNVPPGASYTYQVEAFKGTSPDWLWRSACSVDVNLPVPPAPDSLTATRYSEQEIQLTWNDTNNDETSFSIERCEGAACSDFVQVASPPPVTGQGSYIDKGPGGNGLLPNHLYRYRIRAVKLGGTGWPTAYSNEAEATPTIIAPDNLAARAIDPSRIDLTWTNHTTWETGFSIGRCEVGGDCPAFTEIATTGPGVNKFKDTTACENTTFQYQVTAINSVWPANPVTAVPVEAATPAVVAPYNLVASPVSESEVDLSWLDSNAAKDGFTVERCDDTLANCAAGTSAYNPIGNVSRSYPVPPPADYTLHYKMDEAAWAANGTDVVVDSVGNNPGTVHYMTASNPLSDVGGRAGNFTNTYNYIKLKNPIVMNRYHSTLSWWMRPATTNNSGLFNRDPNSNTWSIIESRNNSIYAETDNNCNYFTFNGVTKNRDWTMYSIIFDNAHAYLYVNGEYFGETADYGFNNCDNSKPVTEMIADTTLQYIGAHTGYSTSNYAGQMDEVGFFDRVLSAKEIKSLYDSAATKFSLNMEDPSWNGTAGEVTDASFAGHSGTAYGNTTPASQGEHHSAAYFDGDNDYITLGDIDELDDPSSMSISLWFNRIADQTSATGHGINNVVIAQSSDHNNDNFEIGSQGTAIEVYVDSASGADSVKSIEANIQNNTWYHLVLVYDWLEPNPLKIYLDGNLLGQWSDYSGYLASSAASQITLGLALPESSLLGDFKGYIDDVSASIQALDAAEVANLYHGTYLDTGLSPLTTYTYRVKTDRNAGCQFHTASTPVEITTPAPPGATNVTASGVDTTTINLTWTNKAGSATANRVLRCQGTGCTDFVQISPDLPASTESYSDTGICQPGTYRYRIAAVVGGVEVLDQDGPAAAAPMLPTAPGNLTAGSPSETEVALSWDDNMNEESGYKIERCLGSACVSTQTDIIGEMDYDFKDDFANGVDSNWGLSGYLQTTALSGPAINISDSSGSAAITAVNGAVDMVVTSTGSGLDTKYNYSRMTAGNGILAALGSGNFDVQLEYNMPDGIIPNTLTQNFIPLRMHINFGNDLIFLERGFNAGSNFYNAYSNISSVTGGYSIPTTDTSGKLRIARTGTTLSCYVWTNNDWFLLYSVQAASAITPTWISLNTYAESNEAATVHVVIDNFAYTSDVANAYNYTDHDLSPPNTTYTYKVYPFKGACLWDQNYAAQVEAVTQITPPAALVSTMTDTTEVDLQWNDTTTSETGFEVERCDGTCVDTDPFVKIADNAADLNSYVDNTLTYGTTYSYRVRAVNNTLGWSSGYSNILTVTTAALAAPSSLVNNPGSEARIELAWNRNSNDESRVIVQRGDENCANFTSLPDLPAGAASYTDTAITAATTYCYQVQVCKDDIDPGAADNSWCTPFSNQVLATSSIVAPDPLIVDFVNTTRADLSWSNSTESETGFVIERCEGSACTGFTEVVGSPVASDVTSFTDTGLCSGTTYRYRVRAVNGSQWASANTTPIEVTTATPLPVNDLAARELVDSSDNRQINISWTDVNLDEDSFNLERCEGAGCSNFQALDTVTSQEDLRLGVDPAFWSQNAWLETTSSNVVPVDISDTSGDATITETTNGVDLKVSAAGGGSGYSAAKLYKVDPGTYLGNNDFDIRVNYTLPDGALTGVTADQVYMRLRISFPDPDGAGPLLYDYIYVQHVATATGDKYQMIMRVNNVTTTDEAITTDTTGTLRITRIGNVLTGSAWTAGAWASGSSSEPILADSIPDSLNLGPNANRAEAVSLHTLVTDVKITNSYSDTNIMPSTDYCYRVTPAKSTGCAWDPAADNLYSMVCSKTAPAAPTNLLATVDGMSISLDWTSNSTDESGFEIEKMLDNGRFVVLDTVAPGVTTYTNTTWVQPNTNYSYRVRAIRGADKSAYSNVINATTLDWQEPICVQP